MANAGAGNVFAQFAHRLARMPMLPPADDELLKRYLSCGDQGAFALLVERYAGLVRGVCRRVLGDEHEADDAFQATFLVLVRRAVEIDRRASLGSWLYSVAYRTSLKARGRLVRRQLRERPILDLPDARVDEEAVSKEILPVLDEELHRLPRKYREPLVLCYLEGKTHQEAARLLGWRIGSMSRRLERARELLRNSLVNRGIAVSAGMFVLLLTKESTAAVTAALLTATTQAALGLGAGTDIAAAAPPSGGASLAREVVRSLTQPRVLAGHTRTGKTLVFVVRALLLLALGGLSAYEINRAWNGTAGRQQPDSTTASPDRIMELAGQRRPIRAVAFSPDSAVLASASLDADDGIRLWDVAKGEVAKKLINQHGAITALAYAPIGNTLASGSTEGALQLWDPETGIARTLGRHPGGVTALAFTTDGATLISAGGDHTLKLWDTAGTRQPRTLSDYVGTPLSVAYSARHDLVASGSSNGSVQFWDLASGLKQPSLKAHTGPINALAFTPDGVTLASGGTDQTVALWGLHCGVLTESWRSSSGPVQALAFSPDGRRLASAGRDRIVRIWMVDTGQVRATLDRHRDAVTTLAWAPDNHKLASGSADQTIVVWPEKELHSEK
jgi:RNA polymerase sigma factor (sigma-70 family)